ncbi:MAG: tRNA (adenosine(37)-N6)-threonylcarbamoyltransferase complex dimerization subunit type 1 TsaB [Lutibacter sp.]
MSILLNIETATKNCSVSVAKNGEILSLKEINNGSYSHAESLHNLILETLKEAQVKMEELKAVAISKGPGSYTGLRIGVSAAKGLCFALNIPLISTETLKALAMKIKVESGIIIPLLDARRMEVYTAIFNYDYQRKSNTEAKIIDELSFSNWLAEHKVYFLGDGAEKCTQIIQHKNAHFIMNEFPSAKEMATLSYKKYKQHQFEDVAYFEPYYLKDFQVTKPKKS